MARYIDADLLLKDINKSVVFSVRNGTNSPELRGAKKILDQIIKHKSTADVVEVVRCKDCKHRETFECPMYHEEDIEWDDDGYTECETIIHDMTTDDAFCSYGERKDDK